MEDNKQNKPVNIRQLWYGLYGYSALAALPLIGLFAFGSGMKFGWNDDFLLFNTLVIDTPFRYFLLVGYVIFSAICTTYLDDTTMPVIGFSIFNPDKQIIYGISSLKLNIFGNAIYMVSSLRSILSLWIAISQLDMAIIRVLAAEITAIFTVRMLLKEKTFIEDISTNESEIENLTNKQDKQSFQTSDSIVDMV